MGSMLKKVARRERLRQRRIAEDKRKGARGGYKRALELLKATKVITDADPAVLRSRLELLWNAGLGITQSRAEDAAICTDSEWTDELIPAYRAEAKERAA